MPLTPKQRVRKRPFLCRFNIWHRWEIRRIRLTYSQVVVNLPVCTRCRTVRGWS